MMKKCIEVFIPFQGQNFNISSSLTVNILIIISKETFNVNKLINIIEW